VTNGVEFDSIELCEIPVQIDRPYRRRDLAELFK